jgi:MoaA/NifB/PqqE/SkfB family radical SAM enzyme
MQRALPAISDDVFHTREKLLTRRGVLWLGQTCNIRCHFCYFLDRIADKEHLEHPFMGLEKAKAICHDLRFKYGNTSIDIQGGEPTIWRHIDDLVAYCVEIGLYPTLITNAIALAKKHKAEAHKAAGVRDLLISVHALGETYDDIVGLPGGSEKQLQGIVNCIEVGIPFRFNCVLSKKAIPQFEAIAELAVAKGARAVNFLAFNPFEDQAVGGHRSTENVPRYSEVAPALNRALDVLDAADIEANVRYFPICMVESRHRKTMYNFQQLAYDPHEWDYDSWTWTGEQAQRMKWGDPSPHHKSLASRTYPAEIAGINGMRDVAQLFVERLRQRFGGGAPAVADELGRSAAIYRDHGRMRAMDHCRYQYAPACERCDARGICDGFHGDYAEMFGTDEVRPIDAGGQITDPTHFIREQVKVYEAEERDRPWTAQEKDRAA